MGTCPAPISKGMANQQLFDYVKTQLAAGAAKADIKNALLGQRWQDREIEEAFAIAQGVAVSASGGPLPGIGQLLREAWSLYTNRLPTLAGIVAIPAVLAFLALLGSKYIEQSGAILQAHSVSPAYAVGFIVGAVVIAVLGIWAQGATLYALKDSSEGIGIGESYKRAAKSILPLLWVYVLSGFVVFGGVLLALIPGVVFMIWFIFAPFALIVDGERGMRGLLKSKDYVRGYFWDIFFRFILITVANFIIGMIIGIVGSIFPAFTIVSSIVSAFIIGPFVAAYLFLLFMQMRSLKSGAPFAPTGGQKGLFIGIAIAGLLIIPLILISIVFTSLDTAHSKASEAVQRANLKRTQVALEVYRESKGNYPASLAELAPEYMQVVPAEFSYRTSNGSYELCPSIAASPEACVSGQ